MHNFKRPFRIFCGGEITNYVAAVLQRDKAKMTGQLQFGMFYDGVPLAPLASLAAIRAGAPIMVYVGNRLAFVGTVDNRGSGNTRRKRENVNTMGRGQTTAIGQGKMAKGHGVSTHIGPNEYTITVRARGETKRLVDSSHFIDDSCLPGATCRSAIEKLIEPFGIRLDWRAKDYDLDVATFRDGGLIYQEIDRIATDNGLTVHEAADGTLRVTDEPGQEFGEALIMGDNILEFETEQGEDDSDQEVVAKGRRRKKGVRGEDAVMRKVMLRDETVPSRGRITLQGYGDGTDDMLERRAKFELDRRAQMVKQCRIQVFHVLQRDGSPWDIGLMHHVRIPSEGIDDVMECISLTYTVNHDRTCHTTLTLAPPAAGGVMGGIGAGGAGAASGIIGGIVGAIGAGRMALGSFTAAAAQIAQRMASGTYPLPWSSPLIRSATSQIASVASPPVVAAPPRERPPLTIDEPVDE